MIDFMQTDLLEKISADDKQKIFQYMMDNANFSTEPATAEQWILAARLQRVIGVNKEENHETV